MYFALLDLQPAQVERGKDEAVGAVCVYVSADCVCVVYVATYVYMHMCWICTFMCAYWEYMFSLTTGWTW